MKKISLIAGLAMLVTVGGVFAAWTFGQFTVEASDTATISVSVDEGTITDNAGNLAFETAGYSGLKFVQDDLDENEYNIETLTPTGYVKYTYDNEGESTVAHTVSYTATLVIKESAKTALATYMDVDDVEIKTSTITVAANTKVTTAVEILSVTEVVNHLEDMDLGAITAENCAAFQNLIKTNAADLFSISITASLA